MRDAEADKVTALDVGADDYLTKPFSPRELVARIKAILRRAEPQDRRETLELADVKLDRESHDVTVDGEHVELTAKEFELLAFFARSPGRVYTRAQLLDQVWGYSHSGYEHTVNSHINRLRNKIERDPANPVHIQTVWGVGYKFAEGRHPQAAQAPPAVEPRGS